MQFNIKVKRTNLMEALRCQQSVLDRKATQSIFSHVKLDASNGKLNIEGSDGNLMLKYQIDCETIANGAITLPGHILYNLVRKSNKEFLNIKCSNDSVEIDYGSGSFNLNTLDPEDFPKIPEVADSLVFKIFSTDLLEKIKMVKIAMANDEIRAHFNGIHIEGDEDGLRFVATDGHKMAVFTEKMDCNKFDMILSRKSVETIVALISHEEEICCYKDNNQVMFKAKNFFFISRLVNGSFPDYKALIPNSIEGIFQDSIGNLKSSLDRISILSSQLSRIITTVKLQDESIIKCDNISHGWSGEEKLEGEYKGSDFAFNIDANIWLDFLRLFEDGKTKLEYHGINKAILMKHENYNNFTYITMPGIVNSD
ncbi:DNA polymerase III subunit beta [Candidatus Cytomitobacter indipagum]|uniref:Beta sliding clamp n=1 Tax=Candidatus Cytomitobacter indipagum TaxID=2601575 RepID=A0A5C0UD26_9PROT|nr:DNA polymerase III subunit beta [Candidatus Cytomitobacter indipagum]QEK37936.1 DNA polymerase III subunit beta [Candidatus Cytomitobacter indipagum]